MHAALPFIWNWLVQTLSKNIVTSLSFHLQLSPSCSIIASQWWGYASGLAGMTYILDVMHWIIPHVLNILFSTLRTGQCSTSQLPVCSASWTWLGITRLYQWYLNPASLQLMAGPLFFSAKNNILLSTHISMQIE